MGWEFFKHTRNFSENFGKTRFVKRKNYILTVKADGDAPLPFAAHKTGNWGGTGGELVTDETVPPNPGDIWIERPLHRPTGNPNPNLDSRTTPDASRIAVAANPGLSGVPNRKSINCTCAALSGSFSTFQNGN